MIQLAIFIFSGKPITQRFRELLKGDRYCLKQVSEADELLDVAQREPIDCLIIASDSTIVGLFNRLYEREILLPTIIIESADTNQGKSSEAATCLYHSGEVRLLETEIEAIAASIDRAIAQFLHLEPSCNIPTSAVPATRQSQSLIQQQHRLSQKLKERLGYLGVYYQREPQKFYRNLQPYQKKELLSQLKIEYRHIILDYFSQDSQNNQIDQFVNQAFFADLAISQVLEMHMELMDEFSQQLKLEGRSEEILLDYRLTLIDVVAHLGEMYRRSIPKEALPWEFFFQKD